MDWARIEAGFYDELAKIAEVSLSGLSPQALLGQKPTQPFSTPGLAKANSILDRYEQLQQPQAVKMAAPRVPFNPSLPEFNRVTGAKKKGKKEERTTVEQGKSLAGHTLGGMGIGRLVGEMAHGSRVPLNDKARQALHGKRWWGAVAGGGLGALEFARKRTAEHLARRREGHSKTAATMPTPGLRLMASRKVGTKITSRPLRSGPTLGAVTRRDHVGGIKNFGGI